MHPHSLAAWTAFAVAGPWLLLACSNDVAQGKPSRPDAQVAPPPDDHLTGPETQCAECHPQHVDEWKRSSHAYAFHDPVFNAMVKFGQNETAGALGDFCVQCHTPAGFRAGETKVQFAGDAGGYVQPTTGLTKPAMDGVSCVICHSMTQVNTVANADFDLANDGIRRGTIEDPDVTPVHPSAFNTLQARTEVCGTCHVVINPNRVALERTHIEWVQSIFAGAQTCQDCHMPKYQGTAAVGHRTRTVHEHTFVGVDVSLLPEDEFPGYSDMRDKAQTLLEQTTTFTASIVPGQKTLMVEIHNLAGHALPSGATADRQMWVELSVKGADGSVVFQSGTLDENGDLRVANPEYTTQPGSDPSLVLYGQRMLFDPKVADPASTEPPREVDFLWEPNAEISHLIPPAATDRPTYDLSALPAGSYSAELRLLFRTFPPHLLRKLEAVASLDPAVKGRVPTVEMAKASVSFQF